MDAISKFLSLKRLIEGQHEILISEHNDNLPTFYWSIKEV